jgi:hypothetical protein
MAHGFTVFDNNAYKHVQPARLARIVAAERERGIVALASVTVVQELLARAQHLDPKTRSPNRAAIRKLATHCGIQHEGRNSVRFMMHTDSQVYRLLTGEIPAEDVGAFDRLQDLIRGVVEAGNDGPVDALAHALRLFETEVARVEAIYVAHLATAVDSPVDANLRRRNLDYANALIARAEKQYGPYLPAAAQGRAHHRRREADVHRIHVARRGYC